MSRLRPAGGLRRCSRWMSPALTTLAALVVGFAAALPVASAAAAVTAAATGVLSDATLATGTVAGGGSPATGMVHLSARADGNTSLVALVSSDPAVLSVPSEIVPTAGSTTTAFPVTTSQVTTTQTVTVTATVDGGSASGTLTITPSTAPPTSDTVHITRAEWKSGLLRIDATSSDPDAILSVYLTASDSFMSGLTNLGGGTYQAQHEEVFNPGQITVKSNLGGSATATT